MNTLAAKLLALYHDEPVRVNAFVVNVVISLAAAFNVVLDAATVWQVMAAIGLITGIGELTRSKVTPA